MLVLKSKELPVEGIGQTKVTIHKVHGTHMAKILLFYHHHHYHSSSKRDSRNGNPRFSDIRAITSISSILYFTDKEHETQSGCMTYPKRILYQVMLQGLNPLL